MEENVIIVEATSTTVVTEQPITSVILANPVGLPGPTTYVGEIGGNAPDRVFNLEATIAGGVTP